MTGDSYFVRGNAVSVIRYAVDSSWKLYQLKEAASEYRVLSSRHRILHTIPDGEDYIPVLYTDLDPLEESLVDVRRSFNSSIDTGYPSTVPIKGGGTIYIKETDELNRLVGNNTEVHADVYISASTSFDSNYERSFTLDFGGMLIGSASLLAAKWMPVGSHGYKLTLAAGGILASATSGYWRITVAWAVKHDHAIDDQWDSLSLFVDITTTGFVGKSVMRVLDS